MRKTLGAMSRKVGRVVCLVAVGLLTVSSGGASYVAAVPSSTGLVAHWSYDQSSGTTLTDNSGNGHTGTFSGTPTWTAGKTGNALAFDGTDAVGLGSMTQMNGVSKLTLATWMKRSVAGSTVLIGKQATNQDVAIEAWSDGKVYFQMSKGADTYGTVTLNDTAWHHVVMVFDGTLSGNANRLKAYVDGVQKTLTFKGTVGTVTTTNTTAFNLGKVGGTYSRGQIDDTWLYARALSLAEVQDLMQLAQPVPDTTAPSVALTAPADGVTVSGVVAVTAAASDDVAVRDVAFAVDGVQQGAADATAPYGTSLNTTTLTNGMHVIRATATDTSGNAASVEATVTVDNQAPPVDTTAPTVAVSAPAGGATVSGTVTVSATATDDVGVAGVKFYANGTQLGSEVVAAPYGVAWNTATAANGAVQLTAVARDAAGNTATSTIVNVTVSNVAQTAKYVTGVSANGRYFIDQTGAPILIKGDSPWAMFSDLSPAQVELWAANREGHGFNAAIVSLVGDSRNGGPSNTGATYDGIQPFISGNITNWNEAYWARMDNYLTILKNHGITAYLYPMDGWTTLSGGVFYHKSAADSYTYGRMVAQRFASYPNIVWMVGGDYQYYDDANVNTEFQNLLSGIRSTGDQRLFSVQHTLGSLSTDIDAYEPIANWNFAYTYSIGYAEVLRGYDRAPSVRDPRPVVLSESNYEGENNTGGPATTNESLRRQQLWALTSGSAGEFTGSQDWLFIDGWETRLDTVWISQMQKLRNLFVGLNWHLLAPDEAAPLVTAGRGTKLSDSSTVDVLQNDYVTAAQTPDKSQSIVYVPTSVNGASTARTLTIDLTRLPASYTATWVDPTDATVTQPAVIDGAGHVTTPGLHSDGTRDWLLLIQG